MSSDAALLRAQGVEVTLAGQSFRLRYDFDALEKLETEFDGLDNFINDLSAWTRRFRAVRAGLVAGLALQLSPEEIGARLNDRSFDLPALITAINDALSEGMGLELVEKDADPKAAGSADSPGADSTSTPLSVMDGQTPSSGE